MKKIIARAKAKTPSFFKRMRNIGLMITAIAASILTAPVTLPSVVITAAGYLATAGLVASGISQLTRTRESGRVRIKKTTRQPKKS